jgi:hypothetical protein
MNDWLAKLSLVLLLVSFLFGIGFTHASTSTLPETGGVDMVVQSTITANDLKPAECAGLNLQNIVTGSGSFAGTTGNDLILGSAGSDIIDSLAGNDCLVGGDGVDQLYGSIDSLPESVADLFNVISFSNHDGTQPWSSSWSEIGEADGPVAGDVNIGLVAFSGIYTATALQDAYISSRNPNTNYGVVTTLNVSDKVSDRRYALYHFDLSQLPAGANITSATVSLYVTDQNNRTVNIHRITSDWRESTVTWNNANGSFNPAPSALFIPVMINQYIVTDITTLVQQWASGSVPNYGMMLVGTVNNQTSYASRENTPDKLPYLTIRYTMTTTEQALRIQNASKGAWRQADLSTAVAATLQFSYLRSGLVDALDYVTVEISNNSGASWVELARFIGPANDTSYLPAAFKISSYLALDSRIRFSSSSTLGVDERVFFDNIQIVYMTSSGGYDVLLGGAGDDTLDGGPGMDSCYGGGGSDTFIDCEITVDP